MRDEDIVVLHLTITLPLSIQSEGTSGLAERAPLIAITPWSAINGKDALNYAPVGHKVPLR